jgi:hypothetical protein
MSARKFSSMILFFVKVLLLALLAFGVTTWTRDDFYG